MSKNLSFQQHRNYIRIKRGLVWEFKTFTISTDIILPPYICLSMYPSYLSTYPPFRGIQYDYNILWLGQNANVKTLSSGSRSPILSCSPCLPIIRMDISTLLLAQSCRFLFWTNEKVQTRHRSKYLERISSRRGNMATESLYLMLLCRHQIYRDQLATTGSQSYPLESVLSER